MSNIQTPDFLGIAETLKTDMRRYAKVYCLQWFDDSFQKQGFTDASFKAWEKRKNTESSPDRRPGGAILINTAFLRRSLAVMGEEAQSVAFGTHVPYAGLHNNGGRLRVIQNVRGYHNNNFMGKGKRVQIHPHMRKIDAKFPQRQFIGHSQNMMKGLDEWLLNQIQTRFKQQ